MRKRKFHLLYLIYKTRFKRVGREPTKSKVHGFPRPKAPAFGMPIGVKEQVKATGTLSIEYKAKE